MGLLNDTKFEVLYLWLGADVRDRKYVMSSSIRETLTVCFIIDGDRWKVGELAVEWMFFELSVTEISLAMISLPFRPVRCNLIDKV